MRGIRGDPALVAVLARGRARPARLAPQHPSPLRHRQRLLPALARPPDGLHLRLLPHARRPASRRRRSPRWTTSAASCACGPGESVVEAGCGWGALALHMARHYGVSVRAFNISREQIATRAARAADEGLTGRVEFVEDDYRNIAGAATPSSRSACWSTSACATTARSGASSTAASSRTGAGLLHFIGRNRPGPLNPWIEQADLPRRLPADAAARCMEEIARALGFSVLDVENLRLHYARTLRALAAALRGRGGATWPAMFDEPFVRAWRLYLAGSEAAFATGWLQLFQVAFAAAGARTTCPGPGPAAVTGLIDRLCDVLIVGGGPAGSTCAWRLRPRRPRRGRPRPARASRATRSARAGSRPRSIETLEIDLDDYAQGRTLQPITGFRTGVMGRGGGPSRYPGRRELRDPALRVRRVPAAPVRRPARPGAPLADLRRRRRGLDRERQPAGAGAGGRGRALLPGRADAGRPARAEPVVAAQEIEFELDEREGADAASGPRSRSSSSPTTSRATAGASARKASSTSGWGAWTRAAVDATSRPSWTSCGPPADSRERRRRDGTATPTCSTGRRRGPCSTTASCSSATPRAWPTRPAARASARPSNRA